MTNEITKLIDELRIYALKRNNTWTRLDFERNATRIVMKHLSHLKDKPESVGDDEEAILNSEEEWRNEDWSPYNKKPESVEFRWVFVYDEKWDKIRIDYEVEIKANKGRPDNWDWPWYHRCKCDSMMIRVWDNYCSRCWAKIKRLE